MSETTASTQSQAGTLYRGLSWLVSLLMPVAIVLVTVRLFISPLFLPFEYNRPGFPADPYGFTTQERMHWARLTLEYMYNSADISFLENLQFEDGTPIYNERELSHMVDVKMVFQGALTVLWVSLAVLLLLGLWAWRGGWLEFYRRGVVRGAWLTVLLLASILALVLLTFGVFFVAFHNVFFAAGTWTFLYTDTLIRLFPEQLWQDLFLAIGATSVLLGLLIAFLFRRPLDRRS